MIAAATALSFAHAAAQENPPAPADAATQQPAAPEVTRRAVGDWTVVCEISGSPCAMEQVGKTAAGEEAVVMQVEKLPKPTTVEGRRVVAVANILTPRNAFLQPGVRLRIDGGEARVYPYYACQNNGCIAQVALDETALTGLRRGARLAITIAVFQPNGPASGDVFVSLSGFTRAFEGI